MNITIPWNILRALLQATSKDRTRYILQGIQVEPKSEKEVVLIATDGRILCAALIEADHSLEVGKSFIIPSELLKRCTLFRSPKDIAISKNGNAITLSDPKTSRGLQISMEQIDGNYPNWRPVVKPSGILKPGTVDFFSCQITQTVLDIVRLARGKKNATIETFCGDRKAPHFVHVLENMFIVFMPIRSEKETFSVPSWADSTK